MLVLCMSFIQGIHWTQQTIDFISLYISVGNWYFAFKWNTRAKDNANNNFYDFTNIEHSMIKSYLLKHSTISFFPFAKPIVFHFQPDILLGIIFGCASTKNRKNIDFAFQMIAINLRFRAFIYLSVIMMRCKMGVPIMAMKSINRFQRHAKQRIM